MSDNYDPLTTQTAAITFRRLDALNDSVAAFGKTGAGAPVAILVSQDGTLQTRRLNRLTDEILLIGTDPLAVARPLLVDSQGRISFRPLSATPITDFDGVRAFLLAPGSAQVQGKADADGTLHVHDETVRARLANVLAQLDLTTSGLRDGIAGVSPSKRTLFELDQDLTAALQAVQPRSITNFPADYPDALSQSRLQGILAQLDRTLSEVFDVKAAHGSVTAATNNAGLTLTLDLGLAGRPVVQRFFSVGGASTVLVQASRDGASWRTVETQTFAVASTSIAQVPGFGYRFVRVTSPTTGIALEFELSGVR